MAIELERVGWENGTLVTPARVEAFGQTFDVTPEVYSGNTPLSAENLKEMEDNTEKAINQISTNSTTEKVVGTWIDGKPLYEITLTGTKSSGSNLVIDIPSNIKSICSLTGIFKAESGTFYSLNRTEPDSGSYTRTEINLTTNRFIFKSNGLSTYFDGNVIATLRYTKTTD